MIINPFGNFGTTPLPPPPADAMYFAGNFTTANGTTTSGVAKYAPSTGTWTQYSSGPGSGPKGICFDGTDLYVGSDGTPRATKWNGSSWSTLGTDAGNTVLGCQVYGGDIYYCGAFSSAGGVSDTAGVAYWDGSAWNSVGASVIGTVYDMAWDSSGTMYIVGSFTGRVAYWSGSAWTVLGGGVTTGTLVECVEIDSSDNIYIGGDFSEVDGNPALNIAYYDGIDWNHLGSGLNSGVNGLYHDGTNIYATGDFTASGATPVNGISYWDGAWNALGTGATSCRECVKFGTDLYVVGAFTSAGGVSANRFAKWNGSVWSAVGSGFNGTVFEMTTA